MKSIAVAEVMENCVRLPGGLDGQLWGTFKSDESQKGETVLFGKNQLWGGTGSSVKS